MLRPKDVLRRPKKTGLRRTVANFCSERAQANEKARLYVFRTRVRTPCHAKQKTRLQSKCNVMRRNASRRRPPLSDILPFQQIFYMLNENLIGSGCNGYRSVCTAIFLLTTTYRYHTGTTQIHNIPTKRTCNAKDPTDPWRVAACLRRCGSPGRIPFVFM